MDGQVADRDRRQRAPSLPGDPGLPAQLGNRQPVAGPEPDDHVGELVAGGLGTGQQSGGEREPLIDWAAAGPAQQLGERRAARVERGRGLRDRADGPVRADRRFDGGTQHLCRVMQRGLLADYHPTDHESAVKREMGQMFEQVALPRAEPAAEQQPAMRSRAHRANAVEQLAETVLDLALAAAEGGDAVPARHPRTQCFDGPARGQSAWRQRGLRHDAASSRVSSRTSAAYGFARRRSRTSSTTRSCNAR